MFGSKERVRALARRLARGGPRPLLDIQRVFSWLPPERPLGEALFRLVEALPRTPDRAGRLALVREILPGAALPLADLGCRLVGRQFVFAESIGEALRRAGRGLYSFDMLGEGARTAADAQRGLERYLQAIEAIRRGGISLKLSSIHERFDAPSYPAVREELLGRLHALCARAAAAGIGLTIDAEESERCALQLDLFAALAASPQLRDWDGLGIAVQAYRRDLPQVLDAVIAAARGRAKLCVRLVKGAYWDTEVKRAQELGLAAYPVHTRKDDTDRSYVAGAARLLDQVALLRPQFATHNPVTAACVLALAESRAASRDYEFQRLHGMGESLQAALQRETPDLAVRVYAPVGARSELLAYLVRRLLENGASTAYVRQAARASSLEDLIERGLGFIDASKAQDLAQPTELHMPERRVAQGYDLGEPRILAQMARQVAGARRHWSARPLVAGSPASGAAHRVGSPALPGEIIGDVVEATVEDVRAAVASAHAARARWAATPVAERAAALERLAGLMEADLHELMALCVWEGGKTLPDALADVREAVDFCRYYAEQARQQMGVARMLRSPAGESNALSLHGRGVFACISPWNFPVAIFTGQVAAALAAGNPVVAKPAEQTPLVAYRIAQMVLEAGIPADVFHLLPGPGETVGRALVEDPRIAGVAFTGSNDTARAIQRSLALREGPLVPLIAETGGLNAMLVDSTALPEQVVDAVLASAFRSAGQRCSSLRMLYLQNEIAPAVIAMLRGATAALRLGDPADPATDVGPVIDAAARRQLDAYVAQLRRRGAPLFEAGPLPPQGYYVAPLAFAVDTIRDLPGERFGPILHVARFAIENLDAVLDDINATGYGLTMGVHTRVQSRIEHIRRRAAVGNLYVNRNMIGAVVGVQPFGGEGLSGTGPKAGGPHYLQRFTTERVCTVNTAAAGGDLRLMAGGAQDMEPSRTAV